MEALLEHFAGSPDPDVSQPSHVVGDVDQSGRIDITDARVLLDWLFLGGQPPASRCVADFDGDGTLNVTDAYRILAYLFTSGEGPHSVTCRG